MRIRLTFGLVNRGSELPYHHQYLITEFLNSYIRHYLQSINYPKKVFYNFSSLKGQTSIGKEGLIFNSPRVSIVFSSNDQGLIESLVNQLMSNEELVLGKLILNPLHVDQEIPVQFKIAMKYLCLSPLTIIPSDDQEEIDLKRFVHPSLDAFSDSLYEDTMYRMEQAGYSAEELEQYFQFQLVPDKEYLDKIRGEEKKFARVFPIYTTDGEKLEVRGYTFPFTLYAHPKVHEFIFVCGLGAFAKNGFGMLDIANEDPHLRIISYTKKINGAYLERRI
jgi:CRISPR-associated endoribonuclease Cas6